MFKSITLSWASRRSLYPFLLLPGLLFCRLSVTAQETGPDLVFLGQQLDFKTNANTAPGFVDQYLLTNLEGIILAVSDTTSFSHLPMGDHYVYHLNYGGNNKITGNAVGQSVTEISSSSCWEISRPFLVRGKPLMIEFTEPSSSGSEELGENLPELVVRGGILNTDQTIDIVWAGGDATPNVDFSWPGDTITVIIPSGDYKLNQRIPIPGLEILEDELPEGEEIFALELMNSSEVLAAEDADEDGAIESATVYTIRDKAGTTPQLVIKVMLQGALLGAEDGLMRDDLRAEGLIPLAQPYNNSLANRFTHIGGGNESTTIEVLQSGAGTPDAIVDWVFLELRDATNPLLVRRTFSGLLQRDGDVVGADGTVPSLEADETSFYVAVKHRNHLGVMTAAPVSIQNNRATVDFTALPDEDVYNNEGYDGLEMTRIKDVKALWAGNSNADEKVKYDGTAADRIVIANNVVLHPDNTAGLLNFSSADGYYQGDVNMDGRAKYDGVNNDRVITQNNVIFYPLNAAQLNNFNNLLEQLPVQ